MSTTANNTDAQAARRGHENYFPSDSDSEEAIRTPVDSDSEEGNISSRLQRTHVANDAPKTITCDGTSLTLDVYKGSEKDTCLVAIKPPKEPNTPIPHVGVDIVLVIDVSYSMTSPATLADGNGTESTGMSILDLTKHAALTIAHTLGPKDRLAIVAFSGEAKVKQVLTPMHTDTTQHQRTKETILSLGPESATALWLGLEKGMSMWDKQASRNKDMLEYERMSHDDRVAQDQLLHSIETAARDSQYARNTRAVYLLTDGQPTDDPPCPYEIALEQLLGKQRPLELPSIHTFAFGYNVRSGLLQMIAEHGRGTFGFIPDSNHLGTVFVNAISNLYSTFADSVELVVRYTDNASSPIPQATGADALLSVPDPTAALHFPIKLKAEQRKVLQLGNLRYGQSKVLAIALPELSTTAHYIELRLSYRHHLKQRMSNASYSVRREDLPFFVPTQASYHALRTELCHFLRRACPPLEVAQEYTSDAERTTLLEQVETLITKYSDDDSNDADLKALLTDATGQIRVALSQATFYDKWGRHYFRSLLSAHVHQACKCFKDAGPQRYGIHSPLFVRNREELTKAFVTIEPPKPSLTVYGQRAGARRPADMHRYYNRDAGCWSAESEVLLADGTSVVSSALRPGMSVATPLGPRRIVEVIATHVENLNVCTDIETGKLTITPWHPVRVSYGPVMSDEQSITRSLTTHPAVRAAETQGIDSEEMTEYIFPLDASEDSDTEGDSDSDAIPLFAEATYTGAVYTLLLEANANPRAHNVCVGGVWAVTLGHGIVPSASTQEDVRAHTFFGDWETVQKALSNMPRDPNGVVCTDGVERNAEGLVCGYVAPMSVERSML